MSRRRQHGGHGNGPARNRAHAPSPAEEMLRVVNRTVAATRGAIKGLAGGEALAAELVASALLSLWRADWPEEQPHADEIGAAVLRKLAVKPDPDVLSLLLAVAAIGAPPLDTVAGDIVAALRQAGVPEPVWARQIGSPALVDAWMSTDELEDQANLVMTFAYGGRPPHVLLFMVDANFGGLIRQALVADDPDAIRQQWREASGLPIVAIDEQTLADRLGNGIVEFDMALEPPTDEEAQRLMPLLRARLRLLPTPHPIEVPDVPGVEREAIATAFAASPEAAALPEAEAARAGEIARWFIDFACDHGAGDPLRWSPIAVELLLADWFPRKVTLEPDEVAAVPGILRAFVRYAAGRKGLAESVYADTLANIDTMSVHFAEDMADDELAGPAKQIALQMRADGVDLTDEAAVGAWIERRNAALEED